MNAHPHESRTPTEPHTHSSAGHAPTAMLRAGQPHSPATPSHAVRHTEPSNACTAPSTQTQPHPASHTLMPPCAQPHLGPPPADPPTVTRREPEVGVCARGQRQYADTGQPSEVSSPAGQMPAKAQARSSPRHEGTPGGRRRPAGSFPPGRAQRSCPCPALQPLGSLWDCWNGQTAVHWGHGAGSGGSPRPLSPPDQGYRAPFLPFLGLGVPLPAPGLFAQGSPR